MNKLLRLFGLAIALACLSASAYGQGVGVLQSDAAVTTAFHNKGLFNAFANYVANDVVSVSGSTTLYYTPGPIAAGGAAPPGGTWLVFGNGSSGPGGTITLSGDCSASGTGTMSITCTKFNGTSFGTAAGANTSAFDAAGTAAAAAAAAQAASLQKSSNLSDVSNVATARANLGLNSAALQPSSAFDAAGVAASQAAAAQAAAIAASVPKAGGAMTGPLTVPQLNSTIYLSSGTLQASTTSACGSGNVEIVILPTFTPSDFAALAAGTVTGCPTVAIADRTTAGITKTYTTNSAGGSYLLGSPGPGGTFYGRNPGTATPQRAGTVGQLGPIGTVATPYVERFPSTQVAGIPWYPAATTDSDNYFSSTKRAATYGDIVGLWGSCTSGYLKYDGSCTTSTTPVATSSATGTVTPDMQSAAVAAGILSAGAKNTWDTTLMKASLGDSTKCPSPWNGSGMDCAFYNANAAYTSTHEAQLIIHHLDGSGIAINQQLVIPTNAGTSNTISILCDVGARIYANAAMGPMLTSATTSYTSARGLYQGCYWDQNHKATGGIVLHNMLEPVIRHNMVNYGDYTSGNQMGNLDLACISCSNTHIYDNQLFSGNTGHTGRAAAVMFNVSGGQIQSPGIVGRILESMSGAGGTGCAATGTYPWVASAGSATAQIYPTGTAHCTAGGGYDSVSVSTPGFMISATGTLTITVSGSPGVTGNAFSQVLDTGAYGYACTKDSEGVISPMTPVWVLGGNQPSTAVAPATYQLDNSAGANYSITQAGLLVSPPTITKSACVFDGSGNVTSGGQITGVTLPDSTVTTAGSNLVGPVYLAIDTDNPQYRLMEIDAPDSWTHDIYGVGGIIGADLPNGGSHLVDYHGQNDICIRSHGGLNFIDNPEFDGCTISGIDVTNSGVVVTNGQHSYNTGSAYPNASIARVFTNNSTFNSTFDGEYCEGLPYDAADFSNIVGINGDPNAPSFGTDYQTGLTIKNQIHCSTEFNLAVVKAAEWWTELRSLGIGYLSGQVTSASTVPAVRIDKAMTSVAMTSAWAFTLAAGTPSETVCIEILQPSGTVWPISSTSVAAGTLALGSVTQGLHGMQCFKYSSFSNVWVGQPAMLNY